MEDKKLKQQVWGKDIYVGSSVHQQLMTERDVTAQLLLDINMNGDKVEAAPEDLALIFKQIIDSNVRIALPFYTDIGRHVRLGKDIFINFDVYLHDLGEIEIGDHVMIGPMVQVHTVDPSTRLNSMFPLKVSPVHIASHTWIGAYATIMPGVTIGENSIILPGSVVREDVPANTIVVGDPARPFQRK